MGGDCKREGEREGEGKRRRGGMRRTWEGRERGLSGCDGGGGGERESSDNGWEGGDDYRKKKMLKGHVRGSCTLVVGVLPFHALQDEALCRSSECHLCTHRAR